MADYDEGGNLMAGGVGGGGGGGGGGGRALIDAELECMVLQVRGNIHISRNERTYLCFFFGKRWPGLKWPYLKLIVISEF